ncbi:MAG: hypothetical protein SWE60_22815, partial [Thermodesulfobacteriota bacterium]|nr:hypothetical protein [Thermodesulfobacteriota bacterium]
MVRKRGNAVHEPITVMGIVIPIEWDECGNPLATIISSPGEEEYLVEPYAKGKELLGLVTQEIEVIGFLRKRIEGGNSIRVDSYRLKGARDWQGEAE